MSPSLLKFFLYVTLVGQYVKKADFGTRTTTVLVGTRKYAKIRVPAPNEDTGAADIIWVFKTDALLATGMTQKNNQSWETAEGWSDDFWARYN